MAERAVDKEAAKRANSNYRYHFAKKVQYQWLQSLIDPLGFGWPMPLTSGIVTVGMTFSYFQGREKYKMIHKKPAPPLPKASSALWTGLGLYTLAYVNMMRAEHYHLHGSLKWKDVANFTVTARYQDDVDRLTWEAEREYPVTY